MRRDLRGALRSLGRDRAFTAMAVCLLALTAGGTMAVYAVVGAVVLHPLPLAQPDRTVVIWEFDTARSTPVVEVGLGEAEDWLGDGSPLESVAVFSSVTSPVTVIRGNARSRATASWVSSRFFDIIGMRPTMGRLFASADESAEAARTAVISEGYWRRAFGGEPSIVGRTVVMQQGPDKPALPVEIVGVAPDGVDLSRDTEVWLPAAPVLRSIASAVPGDRDEALSWYLRYFKVFYALGRLRPDITVDSAERQLGQVVRQRDLPTGRPSGVVMTPVVDYLLGPTQPVLWMLLAGALLMMLLACSSVAGLHVFRMARRDRALAVQMALGADRHRLARQAVVECGLLAAGGSVCALGVAWVLVRVLVALAPVDVPRLHTATMLTVSTVFAAAGLAVLATLLSGLWPAIFVARVDPSRVLTSGARTAMLPRERLLQRLVVGWQVSVAVVLLTGAALFIRSVQQLERTPLGFNPRGLVSVELQASADGLARRDQFLEALLGRLSGLPSVEGAAAIARRPLSGPIGNDTIPVLRGQEGLGPDAPWRRNPRANLQAVTPGYFRTVGARLLTGRDFTAADVSAVENVVIVGASTAARLWPDRDPLGSQILVPTQRQPGALESPRWQTVVGIVEDVRYRGMTDPRLDIYMPAAQSTIRAAHVLVRASVPMSSVVADVLAIARDLDDGVLAGEIVEMTDVVTRDMAPWRFARRVLSAFGLLAALLASLALVGLLSLAVTLRRRELGIRAAIGATPARLRAQVLREAAWVAGSAAGVGALAAIGSGRLVGPLLVETEPHDPVSIAAAVLMALLLAGVACLAPAHRAARADPIDALREP
jgi:predicted permease